MPRGQPDYGIYTETPVASGISDPGEAAARLGSINVYDRRGWTVWMDDFEAPLLSWVATFAGGGITPILDITRAWMGIQSVFFATIGGAGDVSTIIKTFPLVRLGKVGVELWTYLFNPANSYLALRVGIYDSVNISIAELRLDAAARNATIVTATGNFVIATNCFPLVGVMMFTPVKMVVDVDNDMYVRLMIGPDEFDISAYALVPGGATTQDVLDVHIELVGSAAGVSLANVDDFILTQNEP